MLNCVFFERSWQDTIVNPGLSNETEAASPPAPPVDDAMPTEAQAILYVTTCALITTYLIFRFRILSSHLVLFFLSLITNQ